LRVLNTAIQMASRWSVILSSVCLLGRHALAEEFEVFPLSGGIDNGVTVTIDVTGFAFPTQVEFLKPSREVAFRVSLDGSTVTRSSDLGGDDKITLNYGAWPGLSATVSAKFEFTKRSETWAVAIDGKRFPWFDFPHQHTKDELLTHVRVYSGMTDAEVTLERKPCSITCHPDECSCSSSNTTDGECISVTKSGCGRSDETTPDEEEHCCDGLEGSLPIEEGMVDKFVVIQDDTVHVDKVCQAFSASCTAATQFSSKPVKILSVNKEKATVNVFVPFAQTSRLTGPDYALPDDVKFDFPVFALKKKAKVETKLVQFGAGGDGNNPFGGNSGQNPILSNADAHNAVVVSSEETKVPKGWYINLVRLMVKRDGGKIYRWVLFNRFARGQLPGNNQVDVAMQLTDEDVPVMGGCRDSESSWRDVVGRNCQNYTDGGWCNRHGESTAAGKDVFGSDGTPPTGDSLPKGEDPNYITAAYECCECGGGRHDAPEGAAPGPTLLNDNLFE